MKRVFSFLCLVLSITTHIFAQSSFLSLYFEEALWNDEVKQNYDFEKDGIYYKIYSENEVYVTYEYDMLYEGFDVAYSSLYADNINIPSSVTYNNKTYDVIGIDDKTFFMCDAVKSIKIPQTVTYIDPDAFWGCDSITSITFSNSEKLSIASRAFQLCESLQKIIIKAQKLYLSFDVFIECKNLTKIYLYAKNPKNIIWMPYPTIQESYVYQGKTYNKGEAKTPFGPKKLLYDENDRPMIYPETELISATLYVPRGIKSQYAQTLPWGLFKEIKEFDATGSTNKGTTQNKKTYNNGDYYIGDLVNGIRHGYGTYYYQASGSRYEGQWKDGKKHGNGIYYWKSGNHKEGQYINGKEEGEHYYFKAGQQTTTTVWIYKNGEKIGERKLQTPVKATPIAKPKTTTQTTSNTLNGHEYVDLGLPSGTLWATCNLGATRPEEYGDYFAWGETSPKKNYSWETYKHGLVEWSGPSYNPCYDYSKLRKYNPTDNKETLDFSDDAAYVNWGIHWRTPTYTELEELCTECQWEKTQLNGVNGYKVIGVNGKSIFLPYIGYLQYWSSSLDVYGPWGKSYHCALYLAQSREGHFKAQWAMHRYASNPIRPICTP